MNRITYMLKQVVLFIAILAGSQAVGQNTGYYTFIPNAAGNIDKDGFDIGYHAIYSQWDLNGDGEISESEFYTVIFQRLDSNKNGGLTIKEWDPGQKYLFGKFLINNNRGGEQGKGDSRANLNSGNAGFNIIDANNDKEITPGEFDAGLRNTDFFGSYDTNQNGKLDRAELNSAVYINMDLDGNGIIERKEFTTVGKLFIN